VGPEGCSGTRPTACVVQLQYRPARAAAGLVHQDAAYLKRTLVCGEVEYRNPTSIVGQRPEVFHLRLGVAAQTQRVRDLLAGGL
jgi:hypothetical protein